MFDIDAPLRYVVKKEGSDLHVKVDSPPMVSDAFVAPSGLLCQGRAIYVGEVSTRGWGRGQLRRLAAVLLGAFLVAGGIVRLG